MPLAGMSDEKVNASKKYGCFFMEPLLVAVCMALLLSGANKISEMFFAGAEKLRVSPSVCVTVLLKKLKGIFKWFLNS
jgi:hypothetical protein